MKIHEFQAKDILKDFGVPIPRGKIAKTPEGENEFISISKGFVTPMGQKRFKNALGFPAEDEIKNQLVEALQGI